MTRKAYDESEAMRQRGTLNLDGLVLFDPPPPDLPPSRSEARIQKIRAVQEGKYRHWIDRGKPVALEVARAKGSVTAASFRAEAALRDGVLPPTYGEDRTLSFIPAIFAELVSEGLLEKVRHQNGAPVKEYDPKTRNFHVVHRIPSL